MREKMTEIVSLFVAESRMFVKEPFVSVGQELNENNLIVLSIENGEELCIQVF